MEASKDLGQQGCTRIELVTPSQVSSNSGVIFAKHQSGGVNFNYNISEVFELLQIMRQVKVSIRTY